MKLLSNAHTHSAYCDGKSPIADTLAEARRLGFVSIGFSGHASQGFDKAYCMTDEGQREYFAELRALQAAGGMPRVWAGLELDYRAHSAQKRAALEAADYIIGSTHYLALEDCDSADSAAIEPAAARVNLEDSAGGEYVAVDGDAAALKRFLDTLFHGDGLQLARAYYESHVRDTLALRPQIIGHFDLVRKNAAELKLFDIDGAAYRRMALEALERIFASGAVLELNTGGMARGYMTEPYPTMELLCAWRELGGAVTVTSDCHSAPKLGFGLDAGEDALRRAGFKSAVCLGAGDALWDVVEL